MARASVYQIRPGGPKQGLCVVHPDGGETVYIRDGNLIYTDTTLRIHDLKELEAMCLALLEIKKSISERQSHGQR